MGRVVVGVDGTEGAARALERALLEARRRDDDLLVVRAWLPSVWAASAMGQPFQYDATAAAASGGAAAKQETAEQVEKALSSLGARVLVELEVVEGSAGPALLKAARDADLLVVGTHERNALVDRLFGRTTTHVVHHARCPVLLVPVGPAGLSPYRRVVVGVDGSPPSLAALRWAAGVAHDEGCPLVVLHVHTFGRLPRDVEPELGDARAWLAQLVSHELGVTSATLEVVAGAPSEEVLRHLRDDDLLVLGPRGSGGFAGRHLGSVADQCARHAPCCVAVVRGVAG